MRRAFWLDFAWRLPVAVLIRAPILIIARLASYAGERLEALGGSVPGLLEFPRRENK